ncbi:chemotaxis protein CheW [Methanococcus maripaludis]|jgi:purine-binding chemotaxis protein CheW|uniref:Chemotaxis protein CheW n=4 Tax=Methanococcus maripaludis TaxID=39152 RepID=A0A2L1C804_METMI|nr:chemotaxis protein CheW [Methanococcus maripaludis]AEK19934.1 chemotaxis protein CheW [Methanococcus maripaludis X1]AVB75485.1 Chemotaxis protein CheW [Methanococcus maripaludis]MBA2840298.1 purine-binding chemotaxis protein CheW [Methanococcus maripaludis]MBA2850674.1 purine-binding chemotaxis protein CheW [Methanococcus maripaludis]MBA2852905.1 purine-binding chemotaxis protein CheW [Methanococcus maripaludis]
MDDVPKVVVFKLASNEYCLRVTGVREVLKLQDITSIPNTPDYIVGVTNIRGEIMPIIDLRRKLNLFEDLGDEGVDEKLVMVVEIDGVPIGILVDSVSDVMQISAEQIEDIEGIKKNASGEYIEGIAKIGNRLIIILDIKNLIDPQEF